MANYKCPVCWKKLDRREVVKQGEYYNCAEHGSFVHLGFFHKIKDAAHVAKQILDSRNNIVENKKGTDLKCSYCLRKMTMTLLSQESGILLDQCFKCNHIWFDKGELVKVVMPETGQKVPMMPSSKIINGQVQVIETNFYNPLIYFGVPIVDDQESTQHTPIFTFIMAFALFAFTWKGLRQPEFLETWAFDPSRPWFKMGLTLVTANFLHFGWLKLFSNLYFLYMTANYIEDRKGFLFTLQIFLFSGAFGLLAYNQMHATELYAGASGAIAGMLTYFCLKFSHVRFKIFSSFLDSHVMPWRYPRYDTLFFPRQYSVPPEMFFLFWLGAHFFAGGNRHSLNWVVQIGGAFCGFMFFMFDSLWKDRKPSATEK